MDERHRTAFTQLFRVSAYSLAVETGRWNRRERGRLPLEERLCGCSSVQTEVHVVNICPLTEPIRMLYNINNIQNVLMCDAGRVCEFIYMILSSHN